MGQQELPAIHVDTTKLCKLHQPASEMHHVAIINEHGHSGGSVSIT